jgi:hypothetical protein
MRPSRIWRWFTALLLGTGLAGCKSSATHSYPSDPLLVSKRPVEVKPQSTPPSRVASADPVAPPARSDLVAFHIEPPRPCLVSPDVHEITPASLQLPSAAVRAASE